MPVRNRRALLRKTLDALATQTFSDFEVVVVDDGSNDGSDNEATVDAEAGRPVRLVHSGGAGAVAARTAGVDAARGQILAFTDSDCAPTPAWLAATVAAVEAGADLAHGPTQPARALRPLERSLWSAHEGLYPTCNIVVRREAFDAVGGFELRHQGRGSGEDTVFAWRVRRMGRVDFVPDAVVHHAVLPFELRDAIRRTWAIGDFPALTREVPELRGMPLFRHGVSLGRFHRLPVYAMAAAIALRRRDLAALAGGWWVRSKLRELRDYEASTVDALRALPIELGLDVVTAAALAVGSVRSRTLVI